MGERLAIVSAKPQSTRERVVGILTDDTTQIILFDTPGLLEPRYALHRSMQHAAQKAIADADLILHLVDAVDDRPADLMTVAQLLARPAAPVMLILNKSDRLTAAARAGLEAEFPDAMLISAGDGAGVEALLARVRASLPESPFLYAADDVSTQQMRFFVAEFLRESVFEQLDDELPYSVAVSIEEYREGAEPVYIRAVMHVERESQKRILIGAGGSRIKSIGQATRAKVESLVGGPVFLDLWAKVLPNWRRNANALARLGYRLPEEDHG